MPIDKTNVQCDLLLQDHNLYMYNLIGGVNELHINHAWIPKNLDSSIVVSIKVVQVFPTSDKPIQDVFAT